MFARLFRKAEASVDNAIGDFFGRLLIALSFIVAAGFATTSLSSILDRTYGSDQANLILSGGFCVLGLLIALILKVRSRPTPLRPSGETTAPALAEPALQPSVFDDEALMAALSSALPIVLPSLLRTTMKNWHLLLAAAVGLYIFSRPTTTANAEPAE